MKTEIATLPARADLRGQEDFQTPYPRSHCGLKFHLTHAIFQLLSNHWWRGSTLETLTFTTFEFHFGYDCGFGKRQGDTLRCLQNMARILLSQIIEPPSSKCTSFTMQWLSNRTTASDGKERTQQMLWALDLNLSFSQFSNFTFWRQQESKAINLSFPSCLYIKTIRAS